MAFNPLPRWLRKYVAWRKGWKVIGAPEDRGRVFESGAEAANEMPVKVRPPTITVEMKIIRAGN